MYAIKEKMYPTEQLQQLQKAESSQHTQSSLSDIIYSFIVTVTLLCLCRKETSSTLYLSLRNPLHRVSSTVAAERRE